MKKLYLYNIGQWDLKDEQLEELVFYKTNKNIEFGDTFEIQGNYYRYCSGRIDGDYCGVRKIERLDLDNYEELYENNIKCPICGYEYQESWGENDEDDEYECGSCGSILSFSRNIGFTYSTSVVEPCKITKL